MNRKLGNLTVINPGSVGQPRDGDNSTSCAVLDTECGKQKSFGVNMISIKYAQKSKTECPMQKNWQKILRRGH